MGFWNPVRTIEDSSSQNLYLTFDDGPEPRCTSAVIQALDHWSAKATFFVVAQKAKQNKELIRELLASGHAIGNHSLDHRYSAFFQSQQKLSQWMVESEDRISQLIGQATVGFRPPAGVVTPVLRRAAGELKMPIILWNIRFFDTVFRWTPEKALSSFGKTGPGSIVLLHDRQSYPTFPLFLEALNAYSGEAQRLKFSLTALTRERCLAELHRSVQNINRVGGL